MQVTFLVLVNGEYVIVEKVQHEILEAPVTVYNFQVEDFHTYFVANTGVLVHNSCSQLVDNIDQTRVGRWMSPEEYGKMKSTGRVQMSPDGNTAYVAVPADMNAYGRQARPGSLYVEFDVDSSRIFPAGNEGWGQIPGPGSLYDRLLRKKGLEGFSDMPKANNIQVVSRK